MTTLPRWERLPEKRPRQLIQAALREFGEQGYDDTRLDDVAERAGVSKGTIYQYFAGKRALFQETVQCALDELLCALTVPSDGISATVDLRRFMESAWRMLASEDFECVHRLVLAEIHQCPDLAEFYADHLEGIRLRLSELVERGIASKEFRPVEVRVATRMLLALLVKNAVWVRQPRFWPELARRSGDEVLGEVFDFALRALGGSPPGD